VQGSGAQTHVPDPRNDSVLVYVNGKLVPRSDATVSVFDSGFVLGDGVWEGFRFVRGVVVFAKQHLDRLFTGANTIDMQIGRSPEELLEAIQDTCKANGMTDGVHIRLMVTRGRKSTPNQDPRNVVGPPTVVIAAEYKSPDSGIKTKGIALFTSTFRCSGPDVFDLRLNSHSRLNLIQALIQAIKAGAHEALMLDPSGFVASCNSTNFFIVAGGRVVTSTGRFNFKGITRQNIIELCGANDIPLEQRDFTLADAYNAQEAFVTGTFGGLTPVATIDGRPIGNHRPGETTARLIELYRQLVDQNVQSGTGTV
jgi:branched-chain amino acid aminotransferase